MGRSVKYPQIAKTNKSGVVMPLGTTATRPASPQNGTFRYNTDVNKFELYQNGSWINPTSRGSVNIIKDTFTGDGSTQVFGPMSVAPASNQSAVVYVGNVHQNAGVAYTISTTTLSFTSPPNLGQTIEVYHGFDSTDR